MNSKKINDFSSYKGLLYFLSFGLLFMVSFIYFYFFGQGIFINQENEVLFFFTDDYLKDFLKIPGGFLEYSGIFLIQFYYNPFIGSILLSIVPVIMGITACKLFFSLSLNKTGSLIYALFLSFQLIMLQIHYNFLIHHSLGILIVLIWFSVSKKVKRNYLIFITSIPFFYYLFGSFAILYSGVCIVFCFINQKGASRYLHPIFLTVTGIITLTFFFNFLFLQPLNSLLLHPAPKPSNTPFQIQWIVICFCLLFLPIAARFTLSIFNKKGSAEMVAFAFFFPVAIVFLTIYNDSEREKLMRIEKLIDQQNWQEVILLHEKTPSKLIEGQYFYNFALSEKNMLCDRMFCGRQDYDSQAVFLPLTRANLFKKALFYYSIGFNGEALHLAYEDLVLNGYKPATLKLIVKLEMNNGNHLVSKRYLNLLINTIFHRKWALEYEDSLIKGSCTEKELVAKKQDNPDYDFFITPNDWDNLNLALQINPSNKKAFEYLIASMLLARNYPDVVHQIKKMSLMKYEELPRHIEEAVAVYTNHFTEIPYLGGYNIKPETRISYLAFENIKDHKSKEGTEFHQTFWYYLKNN